MGYPSIDLRRQLVEAYRSKQSGTYEQTATLFGVGEATVSRWLRRHRETGDVEYKPVGHKPRKVDLEWLKRHLEANPDARIVERVADWERESGKRVRISTMWNAIGACRWTHKKSVWSPESAIGRTYKRNEKRSQKSNRS